MNLLACAQEMGSERFPSSGSDKPIEVPMRESVNWKICHGQKKPCQLELPRAFLPPLSHFNPGAVGWPSECGRGGGSGWEKYRGSLPLLPVAPEIWSFYCSTASHILITDIRK